MKKTFCFIAVIIITCSMNAQNTALKIGQPAPAISLPEPNGNTVTLSSLKGKLVLIDFWATWCAPCVKEQPKLKTLYGKYAKQVKAGKFEIMGVSLDKNKEHWQKGIERLQINWLQGSDLMFWKSPVAKDYAIKALPYNVIVDEEGNITAIDLHDEELDRFISNYLTKHGKQ